MFWKKKNKVIDKDDPSKTQQYPIGSYRIVPWCHNEFSEKVWLAEHYVCDYTYTHPYFWKLWANSSQFKTPEEAEKEYLEWTEKKEEMKKHLEKPTIVRLKE